MAKTETITVRMTSSGDTTQVTVLRKRVELIQVVLGTGVHSVQCDLKPTRNGLGYGGYGHGSRNRLRAPPRGGQGRSRSSRPASQALAAQVSGSNVFRQGRMDSRLRGNDGGCRHHGYVDGIIPRLRGNDDINASHVLPLRAASEGSDDRRAHLMSSRARPTAVLIGQLLESRTQQ